MRSVLAISLLILAAGCGTPSLLITPVSSSNKLVEETVPAVVKTGDLQKVLQNLLRERVPVRDTETIIETLADWGGKTKDLEVLTEYVRNALRRTICQQYATPVPGDEAARQRIVCVTLDPSLEDLIGGYVDRGPAGVPPAGAGVTRDYG